ncbi:MAG TPA: acetylxylan esterase [Bryobacteraceae bacterium]|nr:acetylxylan esterase [Bryobacteraceae bacterium]
MPTLGCRIALSALLISSYAAAQKQPANYDESKVGTYTLPDPLALEGGGRVTDADTWTKLRRPQILRLFEENVYGRSPGRPKDLSFEVFDIDRHALGGKAIRKQVTVYFSGKKDGPREDVLIYLPVGVAKPAMFLTLNFSGNHTIATDPAIRLASVWDRKEKTSHTAPEASRGNSKDWQGAVERILARGYGVATTYYCDIEPDFNGAIEMGVRPLFFRTGQMEPAADDWGAIAAWGWGLSRAMDYLETDPDVDPKRVAIMGHSRLGKTVLWAGARDVRFAMVIANCSGEGGASLARRNYGETVKNMNVNFPYQFCTNYQKYGDHVDRLPVDTHELIALMAPRPVYLGTAEEDQWADPRGEFLAAQAAGPVYKLFGKQGLDDDQMPELNHATFGTIGYHYRSGKHEVTPYDWVQFLTFADKYLGH